MRIFYFIGFLALISVAAVAQPTLKPSIGLSAQPSAGDSICKIPRFLGSFYTSGYKVGDTIPDFTLYTTSGTAVNMATVLQSKRPVLLVAGSYTCPVYRSQLTELNAMAAYYGSALDIYIIYTVEAHPVIDVSPYSGTVWVTGQNTSSGVLFRQPATYGQRKALVDSMKRQLTISPQILIDGPCNEWWSHFGPAPNNAYLIDSNGKVRSKNGWYNRLPENMWCSIDSLLGSNSGKCSVLPATANFSFQILEDSTVSGPAGQVFTIKGMLRNKSASNAATVNIQKILKNIPAGWESALCTDVCLNSSVDLTQVIIPPTDSQSFIFYFYTDSILASGNVTIGFSNPNNANNKLKQGYYASTAPQTVKPLTPASGTIRVYPNPAMDAIHINAGESGPIRSVELLDCSGRVILVSKPIDTSDTTLRLTVESGIYFIRVSTLQGQFFQRLIRQ